MNSNCSFKDIHKHWILKSSFLNNLIVIRVSFFYCEEKQIERKINKINIVKTLIKVFKLKQIANKSTIRNLTELNLTYPKRIIALVLEWKKKQQQTKFISLF